MNRAVMTDRPLSIVAELAADWSVADGALLRIDAELAPFGALTQREFPAVIVQAAWPAEAPRTTSVTVTKNWLWIMIECPQLPNMALTRPTIAMI